MSIRLSPIDPARDVDALVSFLTRNRFPFHVVEKMDESSALLRVKNGTFDLPNSFAHWIEWREDCVGFVNFQDVRDDTAMLDIRIADEFRGARIGEQALRRGVDLVFPEYPELNRIEGITRIDNTAMRRVFERTGFVKEAHFREAWPTTASGSMDSVAYAMIRRDWQAGTTTPINWDT